ncbi:MAG: TetM/TetW/TetO/TetS family tetracycline resistance ribosomal protection protein [Clostridia bacterium]|nr:TetM/TetW/TetO/TetS family tetracycline resistance ribosomal protection protein [Clostridia bacterium]
MEFNKYCTLGIFAHANAGKTTVTENILYEANIIKKIGRVDDGTTVTDSMSVEKNRGITVKSSVVSFNSEQENFFLIDTPGHVDFSSEVERAINTLDGAILVVSAVEGVEAQTYTIYESLQKKKIPTIVFINKVDRNNADYSKVVNDLKTRLGMKLVKLSNISYDINNNIIISENDIDDLMNDLAEYDDYLVDEYLNGTISKEVILNRIFELSKNGLISVVLGGSALKGIGTKQLYNLLPYCLPTYKCNNIEDFSGYVYMVRVENNVAKTFVKVLSGELRIRSELNVEDSEKQKVISLKIPKGSSHLSVESVSAGQIAICTGLNVKPGQLIGNQSNKLSYISFVNPKLNIQVVPKAYEQLHDLYNALKIMELEDPYLNVCISANGNKKIIISLMGEVQAQIIESELQERFNISVELSHASIIHKEKPTKEGTGEASYTKVSKIEIKVYPLPQGSGLKFESRLSTDYLLRKYQRQTERLVYQYCKQGLYGWEITDALIVLTNGRFDSMGSEPKHFNIAVPLALMRALKNCNEKILEPISEYYVIIPKESMSDVTKELSSRNAFYEVMSENSENLTLHGEIPTKMISDFPVLLSKLTSGRGIFSSNIIRYTESTQQDIQNEYVGFDPRNEVKFVIGEMGGDLDNLDVAVSKKRKSSRAKFKWKSEEKKN